MILTESYTSKFVNVIRFGFVRAATQNATSVKGTMNAKIILAFLAFFICIN